MFYVQISPAASLSFSRHEWARRECQYPSHEQMVPFELASQLFPHIVRIDSLWDTVLYMIRIPSANLVGTETKYRVNVRIASVPPSYSLSACSWQQPKPVWKAGGCEHLGCIANLPAGIMDLLLCRLHHVICQWAAVLEAPVTLLCLQV